MSVATNHECFKLRWFVMVANQVRKYSYSPRSNTNYLEQQLQLLEDENKASNVKLPQLLKCRN